MIENENVHGVGPTPPSEEELDTLQFGVREEGDTSSPSFESVDELFAYLEQATMVAFNGSLPESVRKAALAKIHWVTDPSDPTGLYNKKAWMQWESKEREEINSTVASANDRHRDSLIDYQEGIREIRDTSVSNDQFEHRAALYLAHFNAERKAQGLGPLNLMDPPAYATPYNGIANPAEPLTPANATAILNEALPLGPNAAKLREIYSSDLSPVPSEEVSVDIPEPVAVVSSVSDERVVNNDANAVRHQYRVLSDDEKANVTKVKDAGQAFIDLITSLGPSRENSLAITKMEEGVFWAVKGLTK